MDSPAWLGSGILLRSTSSIPGVVPREGGGDLEFQCHALGFLEAMFGNVHKSQIIEEHTSMPQFCHTPLDVLGGSDDPRNHQAGNGLRI